MIARNDTYSFWLPCKFTLIKSKLIYSNKVGGEKTNSTGIKLEECNIKM